MEGVIIRRKGEGEKKIDLGSGPISLLHRSESLESMLVEMEPNSKIGKTYSHAGEEIRIVLRGEVEVEIEGERFELKEGDFMWFKSELNHRIRNKKNEKAVYFCTNLPPNLEW